MVTFKQKWSAIGKASNVLHQGLVETPNEDEFENDLYQQISEELVDKLLNCAEADLSRKMCNYANSKYHLKPDTITCFLRVWNDGMAYVNETDVVFGNYGDSEYELIAELAKSKLEE